MTGSECCRRENMEFPYESMGRIERVNLRHSEFEVSVEHPCTQRNGRGDQILEASCYMAGC